MTQPRISIITISYNAETTIERTLRSVACQNYEQIEYIIIDGASKDRTLKLVDQYAPLGTQVYSERDSGIYDAMNKGLRKATGDYLWFLNSGDALPTASTVNEVAEAIVSAPTPPDVVYGDCLLIDSEDRVLGPRRLRPPKELSWRSFIYGMLVCHQSFIARRALCPEYNMRYRFSSDVDWCIRVMKGAKQFVFLPQALSLYLNEGATTANHRRSLCERFDILRRHYGLLPTLGVHLFFLLRFIKAKLN